MALVFDFGRLQAILLNTGLQQSDPRLYQFLNSLITGVNKLAANSGSGGGGGGGGSTTIVIKETLIQQLGSSSDADDPEWFLIPGPPGSNGSSGGNIQWSVLTNGDLINPELVFASGDVIMTHIP